MRRYGSNDTLTDLQTASLATAGADVIRSIVGRTRYLYEMVAGRSGVSGEEAIAPRNPCGDIGVNLSGPPWGPALRHTVWCTGGIQETSTTVSRPPCLVTGIILTQYVSLYQSLQVRFFMRRYSNWVRDTKIAPYSRLQLSYCAHSGSGTPTLTIEKADSLINNASNDQYFSTVDSRAITTSSTHYVASELIRGRPGWNEMTFRFSSSSTATASTIVSMALHNVEKLEHTL